MNRGNRNTILNKITPQKEEYEDSYNLTYEKTHESEEEFTSKISSVNLKNFRNSLYDPNVIRNPSNDNNFDAPINLSPIQKRTTIRVEPINEIAYDYNTQDKSSGLPIHPAFYSNQRESVYNVRKIDNQELSFDKPIAEQKIDQNEYTSRSRTETENSSAEKLDFSLKIFIESFEVSYKLCDDFGLIFRPFIEIKTPNESPIQIHTNDQENEKSRMSDRSNNTSMNQSLNLSSLSFIEGDSIERTYYYREVI